MADDDDTMPAPPASLGELAAIGRIERALFGASDRLVRVGRYEIKELLGSGAFGKVYRAHDPELARDVALKIVEAQGADRDELLREARVMATISHPNVAPVHDAGIVDNRVFLAMELVTGGNLRAWLDKPRTRVQILDVLRQAGRGLAAAHAAGVVHRDFKPDNILVGDDGRARVVDFGLSRAGASGTPATPDAGIDTAVTITAAIAGTPAYMSPELWEGQPASALSDQFAFCVTAWEALTGDRPFGGASVGELIEALRDPPRGGAGLGALRKPLAKGLARVPAARHPAMEVVIAALEPKRPRWVVPAALASVAAVGAAVGLVVATRGGGGDPHPIQLPAIDPCPRPTDELVAVWDDPARATLKHAFEAAGGGETFPRVQAALDREATAWLDARVAACVATHVRHAQSPQILDRRVACLRDWRRHFASLTGALVHATPDVVSRAATSVSDLPSLAHCADADAMAQEPDVPDGLYDKLEPEFDKLALARAAIVVGKSSDALDAVGEVAANPDVKKFPPLELEAQLWLGPQLTNAGQLDQARVASRRAFDLAQMIGDKRAALQAATDIAFLGAYDTTRIADAQDWLRTAQSLLAQLDGDRELEARLAHVEGTLDVVAGVPSAAQAALALAVSDFRKLDPEHPALGASLAMLGSAELDLGKVEDAERDLREALMRAKRDLGEDHADVAMAEQNLALVLAARGHYTDATAMLDDSLARFARILGDDHGTLAYASLARAEVDKSRGDRDAAAKDLADALRRARAGYGPTSALAAQAEMATAELEADLGHGDAAVAHARMARDIYARTDAISIALADATLARALAANGDAHALDLARDAATRVGDQAPGAIRGLVWSAYGDVALAHHDAQVAAQALREAEGAFLGGAPSPWRLARTRLSLARALSGPERAAEAKLALDEFPRDGDPALKSAISKLVP